MKKKISHKKNGLTDKQNLFCIEYCTNGCHITNAAISAGYSKKTAYSIGSELLKKPEIQDEVQRLRGSFEELMEKKGVTKEKTILELANIAYSSISQFHNTWITKKEFENLSDTQKSCIAEIDTKTEYKKTEDGIKRKIEFVRIRLFNKIDAIKILAEMMGWNSAKKIDVSNTDGTLKGSIAATIDQLFPDPNKDDGNA